MSTPLTRIDRILFVYAKNNQLRCLTADEARGRELDLLAEGWHHTATIDPAKWIESLPNSDILERVNELFNDQ